MTDLSPLLKVSVRLLDLHDSSRSLGASTQYQIEDRPGLKDGRYLSIAGEVLVTLQASGKQSGDEFSSVDFVAQSVRGVLTWANDLDVEYVLNVLSRPTELKLLQYDDDASSHVIGDKETNLVEKAAHLMAFRLSRLGRKALAMANDSTDLLYIEGDVTKLLRALETGRLKQAMAFLERLIDQLRTEHLALVSIIEKMAGGKRVPTQVFDDLEGFETTMRRTAELVKKVQGQVSVLARGDAQSAVEDDVPFGLVKDRVEELRRGIVGYARALSDLASKSMAVRSTSVQAPAFAKLALQLVTQPPTSLQTDFILSALGPVFALGTVPMGTDLRGSVKVKTAKVSQTLDLVLGDFVPPPEDRFIEWMAEDNLDALKKVMNRYKNGCFKIKVQLASEELIKEILNDLTERIKLASSDPGEGGKSVRRTDESRIKDMLRETIVDRIFLEPKVTFIHSGIRTHESPVTDKLSTGQKVALEFMWIIRQAEYEIERGLRQLSSKQAEKQRQEINRVLFVDGIFSTLSDRHIIREAFSGLDNVGANFQIIGFLHSPTWANDSVVFPVYHVGKKLSNSSGANLVAFSEVGRSAGTLGFFSSITQADASTV